MYKLSTIIIAMFFLGSLHAQELQCKCRVNTPQLQKTDEKVFEDLRKAVELFLNGQKWTDDTFEPEEKIDCNFVFTITEELENNVFSAELTIQSSRPVYGTTYQSPVLSHNDKDIKFFYEQFQPLVYNENGYIDNLSSILSFYAHLILGLDYDSFSPYGGEVYLQKAQEIVNQVPPGVAESFGGWNNSSSTRNRYWIMESTLNPKTKPLRLAMYDYHRSALDIMFENTDLTKVVLGSTLDKVKAVSENYQNAMVIQLFAQAKGPELIEIYQLATKEQKQQVYKVLTAIDPSNASRYGQITRN